MQIFIDLVLILVYLGAVLLLCAWMWRFWIMYVNQKHVNNMDWVMLEIRLPREIMKSPLATELALNAFLQTGGLGSRYKRFWLGNLPAWGSLEIASIEGVIHFYVRVQPKFRNLIESNFYSQYPGIEIHEADDYTKRIRYHHLTKNVSMWGAAYPLGTKVAIGKEKKKGKSKDEDIKVKGDFLPIKTYVDFGLDKDPKEEFKTDPITPMLEFMGTLGKGEHMWYQVVLQDESVFNGDKMPKMYENPLDHKPASCSDLATARKRYLRKTKNIKQGDLAYDQFGNPIQRTDKEGKLQPTVYGEDREVSARESEMTIEERDEIEAINKKLSKPLLRAVVRFVYVAESTKFKASYIQNIVGLMKVFSGWNKFGLSPSDPYEYPWQNFRGRRTPWRHEEMFEAYVEREGFHPHIGSRENLESWEDAFFWGFDIKTRKVWRMFYEAIFHPFDHPDASDVAVLNLEEVATIWHLPGTVAATPTLPRIDSMKGVAPVNLPQ